MRYTSKMVFCPEDRDAEAFGSRGVAGRTTLLALVATANLLASASARAAQYAVDRFHPRPANVAGNPNYGSYTCKPSQQFADALDCQRTQQRKIGSSAVVVSTTLVHARDGAVIYVMMDVAPVAMSSAAVQSEIGELSRAIGAKPASVDRNEPNQDITALITAKWGGIKLEDVQGDDLDTLAAGGSLRLGLPFEPLGNTKLSAEQYLPISRIAGGAGYIYSASIDKEGGRMPPLYRDRSQPDRHQAIQAFLAKHSSQGQRLARRRLPAVAGHRLDGA